MKIHILNRRILSSGEMFDNGIRIKLLKDENKELEGQYDDDEIMAQAKVAYEEDKKRQESGE